jgi:hypothetical protein
MTYRRKSERVFSTMYTTKDNAKYTTKDNAKYNPNDGRLTFIKGRRRYVFNGQNINNEPGMSRCQVCKEPNEDDYYAVFNMYNEDTGARLIHPSTRNGASIFTDVACAKKLLGLQPEDELEPESTGY